MRNNTLASWAGTMRNRGISEAGIAAALLVENRNRCQPPLPDDDVRGIAHSIARFEPDDRLDAALREEREMFEDLQALRRAKNDPGSELVVVEASSIRPRSRP